MVDAMVTDTGAHLQNIQSKRDSLEAMMAEGKPDDQISLCVQALVTLIKDYKVAAGHVKKHCTKPKKAKEAKEPEATPAGDGNAEMPSV